MTRSARSAVLVPVDRTRAGWVVINDAEFSPALQAFDADECLEELEPIYDDGSFRVYGGPGRESLPEAQR